jgi:hypothetical protein
MVEQTRDDSAHADSLYDGDGRGLEHLISRRLIHTSYRQALRFMSIVASRMVDG